MYKTPLNASLLTIALTLSSSLSYCSVALAGSIFGSTSSAGMSAASAGSASLRGSSAAISGSSDSASGADDVAAGQYRLTDIKLAAGHDDQILLSLKPVATHNKTTELRRDGFELTLPKKAIESKRFTRGDTIEVRRHSYGLAFSHQDSNEPFFLVVNDAWELDLKTRVVTN